MGKSLASANRPNVGTLPPDADALWWATIKRDGFACRVASFVPDLACEGDLDCYAPSGVLSGPESAVSVCQAHLGWMGRHPVQARALGLLSGDQLSVETILRPSP